MYLVTAALFLPRVVGKEGGHAVWELVVGPVELVVVGRHFAAERGGEDRLVWDARGHNDALFKDAEQMAQHDQFSEP